VVLLDDDLTGRKLVDTVRALLGDPDRLVAMSAAARGLAKPSAAESVAGEILRLVFGDPRQTAVG
jgi:UDP-N-acetylglucosamine:LPS N-acetylglucosamine transferase